MSQTNGKGSFTGMGVGATAAVAIVICCAAPGAHREPREPLPGERRERRAGVARSVITGIALGFREVFDPEKRDTIVIEQEAPADPIEPQKIELHLDPVDPRDSTAVYRPWLDQDGDPDHGPTSAPTHTAPPPPEGAHSPAPEPPAPGVPDDESGTADPMLGFGF